MKSRNYYEITNIKMEEQLVSIIIPTYKRADMLSRAIRSSLEQTYRNIEVIVVSDNDSDDEFTEKARLTVDSFHDTRVRLITQERHVNGAVARNVGIRASKGTFISFLDDDDYIDKNKIERQVETISKLDESWGGVCCRYKAYLQGKLVEVASPFKSGYVYKEEMMSLIRTQTNSLLLRRDALFNAGLFDENLLRNQDVQLITRFAYKYKIYFMDEYLNNLDHDNQQNRPKPEHVAEVRRAFLNSVKDIYDTLTPIEKYRLRMLDRFNNGALYIMDGQKVKGLLLCAQVLLCPSALYLSIKKVITKKKMQRLAQRMWNTGLYPYKAI